MSIAAGTAPFTGSTDWLQLLGLQTGLSGAAVNGTWLLEIHDNAQEDSGTLTNWTLNLETGDPYAITDANGDYSLNNLSGSPAIVTEQHQPGWRPTSPPFASYYIPDFANGTSYGAGNFLVQADATVPMVTAITPIGPTTTNANTVQFTVTFSEPVVRLLGLVTNPPTADNFGVVSSTLIGAGVTTVTGGGTTYTVTVNTGTGSGFLNLTFANSINVVDFGYNTVGNVGFSSPTITIDRPLAVPIEQVNDGNAQRSRVTSLRVTFGEVIYLRRARVGSLPVDQQPQHRRTRRDAECFANRQLQRGQRRDGHIQRAHRSSAVRWPTVATGCACWPRKCTGRLAIHWRLTPFTISTASTAT